MIEPVSPPTTIPPHTHNIDFICRVWGKSIDGDHPSPKILVHWGLPFSPHLLWGFKAVTCLHPHVQTPSVCPILSPQIASFPSQLRPGRCAPRLHCLFSEEYSLVWGSTSPLDIFWAIWVGIPDLRCPVCGLQSEVRVPDWHIPWPYGLLAL